MKAMRQPSWCTCGNSSSETFIETPMRTTFEIVPRPGHWRSGIQNSSTPAPTTITTVTVPAGDYETEVTGLTGTVASGDLVRLVFSALGASGNFTVELLGSE